MNKVIFILIILSLNVIISCSSSITSYSGKIINKDQDFKKLLNKNELIATLGEPSYIDPIENKFYYYSEKKIFKNFFDQKTKDMTIIFFKFDKLDNIVYFDQKNLNNISKYKKNNDKTESKLINRGLIEKIFGGIRNNPSSNTSN